MNPDFLWQPFAEQNLGNPYPMYRRLRSEDPIHFAQTREVIVSRYDDVKEILKSNLFHVGNRLEWLKRGIEYMQKKDEDLTAIYAAVNSFVLMLNPPQHTRIRTFVTRTWNDHAVDEIINQNIKKIINRLGEKFDAVYDFAQPLSVFTICDILGVDGSDYRYLKDLGLQMSKAVDLYPSLRDLVKMNEAARAFINFFRAYIDAKKVKPGNDLLSKLLEKNKNENLQLTNEELISISIFLFIAGQETAAALIGNGIHSLLDNPSELKKLRNQPALLNSAVEEILRFNSPVQLLGRIASEDYEIGGKQIPKNSAVTLVIGSANRDENIFDNPDHFDIERKPNRHLTFGSGIHFCLGDWLGRRQAQLAIGSFFSSFKNVALNTDKILWNDNLAIRGIKSLPVKV